MGAPSGPGCQPSASAADASSLSGIPSAIRFAGYAAVFDAPDLGKDIIRAGAFRRTIELKSVMPLLKEHRSAHEIGTIFSLSEDVFGLRVEGEIVSTAFEMLSRQGRFGLSFGFRAREARKLADHRELLDLELVEISAVANPLQPLAYASAIEARSDATGTGAAEGESAASAAGDAHD